MNPRILFLDHTGELGGAELYLLDVAQSFGNTSGVVLFAGGPFYERLAEENVDVRVVRASPSFLDVRKRSRWTSGIQAVPGAVALVWRLAREARRFDVIFANSQKSFAVGAIAGAISRRPVVWNLHDMLNGEHFSGFNRRLATQFANRFAARVIANSKATRDAFTAGGGSPKRTEIVYNGIDPTPFAGVSETRVRAFRDELGLSNSPVVGVFSRLTPWKGQHVILKALERIDGVHLLIVGGALFGDDERYEKELRALSQRPSLRNRVHFLGFRRDIPFLMRVVDIVAHTSVAPEPFGRTIVEGMLSRNPVIATAAGGALEIVTHGETGLLVPAGDPTALADGIELLLAHPDEARTIACRAYEDARRRFSRVVMLDSLRRLIEDVALEGRSATSLESSTRR